MKQILPYPLWLGHAGEGRDFRQVFDRGIQAVIDLAIEEAPTAPPRELIYHRVPLLDGAGNRAGMLFLAISTLATLLKMHIVTLVVSGAGISRGPAIAAAALALVHQESPEECLKRVAQYHTCDISPGLWKEVTTILDTASLPTTES